jgi:hypothetical protein
MGKRCGIADMQTVLSDLVSAASGVIDKIRAKLPSGFPARIADQILDGLHQSSGRLSSGNAPFV